MATSTGVSKLVTSSISHMIREIWFIHVSWYSVQVPGCGTQVAAISKCVLLILLFFCFRSVLYFHWHCFFLLLFWQWDVEVAASCMAATLISRYNQEAEL
jgi:hypothetical protein